MSEKRVPPLRMDDREMIDDMFIMVREMQSNPSRHITVLNSDLNISRLYTETLDYRHYHSIKPVQESYLLHAVAERTGRKDYTHQHITNALGALSLTEVSGYDTRGEAFAADQLNVYAPETTHEYARIARADNVIFVLESSGNDGVDLGNLYETIRYALNSN